MTPAAIAADLTFTVGLLGGACALALRVIVPGLRCGVAVLFRDGRT